MEKIWALYQELKRDDDCRSAPRSRSWLRNRPLNNQDQRACQRELEGLHVAEELMNQAQQKAQQLQSTPNS